MDFNWALKLKPENGLEEEKIVKDGEFEFKKNEQRVYPLNIPIDLLNYKWEPVARVVILEYKANKDHTVGKYRVLKMYKGIEKEVLTHYWHDIVEYRMGREIKDFSNVKVT